MISYGPYCTSLCQASPSMNGISIQIASSMIMEPQLFGLTVPARKIIWGQMVVRPAGSVFTYTMKINGAYSMTDTTTPIKLVLRVISVHSVLYTRGDSMILVKNFFRLGLKGFNKIRLVERIVCNRVCIGTSSKKVKPLPLNVWTSDTDYNNLSIGGRKFEIRTDSRYAIDCIDKWSDKWKANNWKKSNGWFLNCIFRC